MAGDDPGVARGAGRSLRKGANNLFVTALRKMLEGRDDWRVLVVAGLRRTGNHAVINWIKKQVDGPFLFYNNILEGERAFERHRREWSLGGARRPTLLLSYEDRSLASIFGADLRGALGRYAAGANASAHLVLIVRDPHNLFASRMKRWPALRDDREALARDVDLYKDYMAVALGDTPPPGGIRLAPVNYNAFIAEAGVRRALAGTFGAPFCDRGLDEVTHYGHGSSFDGRQRTGEAAAMDLFGRWRAFENDKAYRSIFADEALMALATRLFGPPPEGAPGALSNPGKSG